MARVVPTILAASSDDYAERIARVKDFAPRLHIDICDGVFVEARTITLSQVYAPEGLPIDLHLMINDAQDQIEVAAALQPALIIVHFESNSDLDAVSKTCHELGLRLGLAINPETTIEQVSHLLPNFDHLLIFTGRLGHNGGEFQTDCLEKIAGARAINTRLEISVDGGIDQATSRQAVAAGADVLYSGSFIHDAADPAMAYAGLVAIASSESL